MKRALVILLNFTRETGHLHPHLRGAFENYSALLKKMSLGNQEIYVCLAQVAIDAGLDLQELYRAIQARDHT
jgi:DNA-binding phage protein